jgi:hypothetical protein
MPQQMQVSGMTFDPNNANVRALQAQRPNDWMRVMAQSQGLHNPGPSNVLPAQSAPLMKDAGLGDFASRVGQGALRAGKTLSGIPGDLGNVALTVGRRGLNAFGGGVGNATIGAAQKAVGNAVGVGRMSKFNPLNMAAGAGAMGGGAAALNRAINSAGSGAASPAPAAAHLPASAAGGFGGVSQRAQDMWRNLPVEAQYAVGAGVPLALLGGLTGHRGLGALGLGAAALGGAAGGTFGEDTRRMVGKGIYNVGSFFGGGGENDHANQLNMLSRLSPELGATVLMGRDKNLSADNAAKQYEFLTKNKEMISQMLPQLTAKSASYLVGTALLGEEEKAARCWSGYEPVPGAKAYSRGSCRPAGSKKTQKEMKKSSASVLFHHAQKQLEPVVHDKKPTSRGKHVSIVHHDMDLDSGVTLRPEEAKMTPDLKAVSD